MIKNSDIISQMLLEPNEVLSLVTSPNMAEMPYYPNLPYGSIVTRLAPKEILKGDSPEKIYSRLQSETAAYGLMRHVGNLSLLGVVSIDLEPITNAQLNTITIAHANHALEEAEVDTFIAETKKQLTEGDVLLIASVDPRAVIKKFYSPEEQARRDNQKRNRDYKLAVERLPKRVRGSSAAKPGSHQGRGSRIDPAN